MATLHANSPLVLTVTVKCQLSHLPADCKQGDQSGTCHCCVGAVGLAAVLEKAGEPSKWSVA